MYPEELRNVIWMMGPLHIEIMLLSMIGDWLASSGWSNIYKRAEISTAGKINSFLKRKHVKRNRYAHQITLATLVQLAWEAYQQTQHTNYQEWRNKVSALSATETYWFTTIELAGWLWSIFVLIRRYTSLGLCCRSCKLCQMVTSVCTRFKANSKSKKRSSWVWQASFYCLGDGKRVFEHGRRSGTWTK